MTKSEITEKTCNKLISIWAIQDALLQAYRLIYIASISILYLFASVLLTLPNKHGGLGILVGILGLFIIWQWREVTAKRGHDVTFIQNQLMYCETEGKIVNINKDGVPSLISVESDDDTLIQVVTTFKNFENMKKGGQKIILSDYNIGKEVIHTRQTIDGGTRTILQEYFILFWVVIWLILTIFFIM